MIFERYSKNKKILIAIFVAFLLIGISCLAWFNFPGRRPVADIKIEDNPANDIAAQLENCLPKSDTVSHEKCQELLGQINNYNDCVKAGFSIMKSNPPQCATPDGRNFTEQAGNEADKADLIRLNSPLPNQVIKSPLTIKGQARGTWFFEASFPVILTNWDGLIIAQGIATAKSDWMTEEFVPFEAVLEFNEQQSYSNRGALILKKDNPSGLPENDDALEIPVWIGAKE